jgi:hypothetical protein
MDETGDIRLKHCKKVAYMGHRRFLRADRMYQKIRRLLMGQLKNIVPQRYTVGNMCLGWSRILKFFLVRGKEEEVKKTKKTGKNAENNGNKTLGLFKQRSIFWNLPYWKDLMMRQEIDVMHVRKNVCEALVSTLLDIPGKTKYTLNAWMDLEEVKLRMDLHHETLENGSKNFQQLATP